MKISLARLLAVCALLLSLPALAATGTGAAEDAAPPADCTGTLSGAVQGSFRCVMVAVYGFAPGVGAVSFTPANLPPGVQSVTASFQLAGAPRAGSVSFENCVDCMASLNENNGALFLAQKKTREGMTSMSLSSASPAFATPDGTIFTVHGTIDAEMPASSSDSRGGVVQMHVQF